MTLRRVSIGSSDAVDASVCVGVVPTSPRLEATRAKLEERRAGLRSRRRSLLRHPRRRRRRSSCGNLLTPAEEEGAARQQRPGHVRRHSDPSGDDAAAGPRVTFSFPLVTEVETRPYTDPMDKPALFYSRADIAVFKARRHVRDRDVRFAEGMVTAVWEPTVENEEEEREMREGLYYTQEELQGFLKEFLATLENGAEVAEEEEEEEECHRHKGEQDQEAAEEKKDGARGASSSPADEFEFFDDVPLDDGECDDDREDVREVIEDSDSDSDSSDDDDGSSDEEDSGAVWPAPASATPAAAVPALPPASPEGCRASAMDAVESSLYQSSSSSPDSVVAPDACGCGAVPPMMEQRLPALPILGC